MNILLAFKPEPDAGMLAEKDWQAAALDTCGPDVALLRSAVGADEQAAAALLLAQRNAGCEMTLSALALATSARCTGCATLPRWGLTSGCCWRRQRICVLRHRLSPDRSPTGSVATAGS